MSISRTIARPLAVLAAVVATTATLTAPAFANAGADANAQIDGSRPLRQVIPAVQLVQLTRNLDFRTRNVAVTCEGVAVGDATTTRLTECSLFVNGIRWTNAPLALPGELVANTTQSQLVPVGATVQGCATVSAVWTDSTISPSRRSCTAPQVALA